VIGMDERANNMSNENESALRETVLHDWHVANGAKMVPFGGWDMPVQYKAGIIREHLATRRGSGLFDVSHMGRFMVRGKGAQAFLLKVLTNSARALQIGQAQYTFIATDTGGAVDDAYLYRLAADEYLLVVNASNRDKDWQWLDQHNQQADVRLENISEDLGMISLQGPNSGNLMEQMVDKRELPESKRNWLRTVTIDDHPVIVARTGYTGESAGFELFPERDQTVALWEKLIALGAAPIGLGARDSLRLEAGLPLYGHELGDDTEQREIPVFANDLARFAVRTTDEGDYVGKQALERQRQEFIAIKRGELHTPPGERVLPRIVQPIAAFQSRRPLRAGYRVYCEGKDVGYVTSGTTVPYTRFYGQGITATPSDEHDLRPIGLALMDSDLRYRTDKPLVLEVRDDRGNSFEAELVERHMWPSAPYARTYTGFAPLPAPPRAQPETATQLAAALAVDARANTHWRRTECINLIPSEQCTSAFVDALCIADPSSRYNEHNRLKALGADAADVRYYKGTSFIMDKEEELKAALRSFFECSQVETRVISGQMANDTVYDALKQFKNRFRGGKPPELLRRVLVHDLNKGGHLSAQIGGALKNYVMLDPDTGRPAVSHFPFRADNPYRIDVDAAKALIAEERPELIVFGRSVIIHTEPVREIAQFVHAEFGVDNPLRPLIMYDGAHVLGLLGKYFQSPLEEGADVVTGSTHKTYFGPQRGVILSNIEPGTCFEGFWRHVESRTFPGHVSNHHLGTQLGLLGATYEMLQFKDAYPRQVIANAKAFARALHEQDLIVEGERAVDFTETHQVLLRVARAKGEWAADLLERNNIITNPQAFYDDSSFAASSGVRMGTPEMTRYGMQEADFTELAGLLAQILRGDGAQPDAQWREAVAALRGRFTDMHYCLA
jgi:aminomethyltransferase